MNHTSKDSSLIKAPSIQDPSLTKNPLLIAVAPNGARRTQKDHPQLPLSPKELAQTAVECCEAGAAMMHLHVRDSHHRHSLDPVTYTKALKEVYKAVGETMLIQVTSEAAGTYPPEQQMAAMLALDARSISVGLREIIKDRTDVDKGAKFLADLKSRGTLVQTILYSLEDIGWYKRLCQEGVIPSKAAPILLVIGRYQHHQPQLPYSDDHLQSYLDTLEPSASWMVCAFGNEEHKVMKQAIKLGGHCRVGFENNLWLADGSVAPNNAALVSGVAEMAKKQGRQLVNGTQAIELFSP